MAKRKNNRNGRDAKGRWQPGTSGNPKGAPIKGLPLTELMKKYLDEDELSIDPDTGKQIKIARKELFLRAVFQGALAGDHAKQKLIWNYIDGLPKLPIAFEGHD